MKKLLNQTNIKLLSLIVLLTAVTFFACKRTADVQTNKETFGVQQAKEWYYGYFKKSAEFINSSVKGKQLPDWKNGTYRKMGDLEIVEFPLLKENSTISVVKDNSASSQGVKQIINASLKKIAFIKKVNTEIVVREIDYIPNWSYLQTKAFDISTTDFGSKSNDFTGMITTKKWGGITLAHYPMVSGKYYSNKTKANTTSSQQANSADCPDVEWCTYSITCIFELHGDVWINTGECSDPVEISCVPIPDPNCSGGGGGGGEDPCETYGICGDGEEEDDCTQNSANALSIMNDALSSAQFPNVVSSGGSATYSTMDENGEIFQTKEQPMEWQYYSFTNPIIGPAHYTAYYKGFLKRLNNNSEWVFSKPADYVTHSLSSGSVISPYVLNTTFNEIAKNIRSDKKEVSSNVIFTIQLIFSCGV